MTQRTRTAVTYGAVVALASALLAPATSYAAPGATGAATPSEAATAPAAAPQTSPNTQDAAPQNAAPTTAVTPEVSATFSPQAATQQPAQTQETQQQAEQRQTQAAAVSPQPDNSGQKQLITTDDGATITGVKVAETGKDIEITGTGWKDKTGAAGSVIAVKYDGGSIIPSSPTNYEGTDYAPRGVVAVIKADAQGNFTAKIPFPTSKNSNVKASEWAAGSKHTLTFLSGSLKKGADTIRLAELEVTVGAAADPNTPQKPKDENDQSTWVELKAPATGNGSQGVLHIKPYTTGKGSKLRITGTGWTNATGNGASTLALKLNYLKDGKPAQYSRTDKAVSEYLQSKGKAGDPTTWVLLIPDASKANPAQGVYALNADGSFDIEIDAPEQLQNGKTGDYLSVTAQTGRNADGDTQRQATSNTIPINGVSAAAYKEPENNQVCTPENGDFTPKLRIENPNVAPGGKLHIIGSGWCNPDDKRVSKIGLKIDDGSISHNAATAVDSNRTVWAVVNPDPKTGNIDQYIEMPTEANTELPTDPAKRKEALENISSGQHTLRLLTGSLRKGDRHGTYGGPPKVGGIDTTFVIGEYKPGSDPDPVTASQLSDADRHGVSVTRDGKKITVKVPESEPGTWVKVTPYLGDSAQLVRASKWLQLDSNRSVSYTMTGELPAADYRMVVQSGNQGESGKVLGWAPLNVAKSQSTPTDGGGASTDLGSQMQQEVFVDENGDAWDNNGNYVPLEVATVPYSNAGSGYVTAAIPNSLGAAGRSVVITRALAKPRTASSASKAHKAVKTNTVSQKKTVQAKKGGSSTEPDENGTQAQGEHKINGTELTGVIKWFANNANNVLLSLAGLVLLALALTYKKKNL